MSAISSLAPGSYVIYAEDVSNKTATDIGRSNVCVACPLAVGGSLVLSQLANVASAGAVQMWLVTGDGMLLSKSSNGGQLAQIPTYYATFTNTSQAISTVGAPSSPSTTTKFVIQIVQSGPSSSSDPLCYLGTVMTSDLTDQYWGVDSLTANDVVKADAKKHLTRWVFVPID